MCFMFRCWKKLNLTKKKLNFNIRNKRYFYWKKWKSFEKVLRCCWIFWIIKFFKQTKCLINFTTSRNFIIWWNKKIIKKNWKFIIKIKHLRKMLRIFYKNNSKKFIAKNVKKRSFAVQVEIVTLKQLTRKK